VSRSDDERVADILEAAAEIAAVIGRGKPHGTPIGSANSPWKASSRSSASPPDP